MQTIVTKQTTAIVAAQTVVGLIHSLPSVRSIENVRTTARKRPFMSVVVQQQLASTCRRVIGSSSTDDSSSLIDDSSRVRPMIIFRTRRIVRRSCRLELVIFRTRTVQNRLPRVAPPPRTLQKKAAHWVIFRTRRIVRRSRSAAPLLNCRLELIIFRTRTVQNRLPRAALLVRFL